MNIMHVYNRLEKDLKTIYNDYIDPYEIQILLYLIQKESLKEYMKPAFKETFLATPKAPLVLFNKACYFNDYESLNITEKELNSVYETVKKNYFGKNYNELLEVLYNQKAYIKSLMNFKGKPMAFKIKINDILKLDIYW